MNKKLVAAVCAVVAGGSALFAEDAVTVLDFETDPGIKTQSTDIPGHREKLKYATFAVPATDGKSFAVEFELNIKTFNHYGSLVVGLQSAKHQKLQFNFQKADDRVNRCRLTAQVVPGMGATIKPFDNIEMGKMTCSIVYNAARREVNFLIRNMEGKDLFDSGAVKLAGRLNLDGFIVGVGNTEDDISEVSYDPEAKAIFARSYVGVEGEYPYVIEAMIDNVTVSAEK